MGGFNNISDLLSQNSGGAASPSSPSQPVPPPVDTEVHKAFTKKMQQVGFKEQEVLTQRKAAQLGIPYLSLENYPISHATLELLDHAKASETGVVPLYFSEEQFRLGAIDGAVQTAAQMKQELESATGAVGQVYFISKKSYEKVLELYKTLPTVEVIKKDVSINAEALAQVKEAVTDFATFQDLLEKQSTTDLVTFIMGAGMKLGASDIHIEAEEEGIVLRFRIDGVLHDAAELPKEEYRKLISRLKLVASLKINIDTRPQDGRFSVELPDGNVDVRVSTIPTMYGESVVMRLLIQRETPLTLEELGLTGRSLKILKGEIDKPNGMIITTGPTGSGKTTTLYSIMHLLNKPGVKIITLEDPVEYKMEGINQSQIDKSKDYTFAKGLKSMLRQDPDIAMVGEIRDLETADIAIQASLTGHLMLSTLHTNNAFGAIPRFLAMGVKPFLLAPAMNVVIGQRLVRRLDAAQKIPATLTDEQTKLVDKILGELPDDVAKEVAERPREFYTVPQSDDETAGYSGRIGIYEIVQITDEVEENILAGNVSESAIFEVARSQGTITMAQDGIIKALDGLTSVEEVFRVIQ